ncbi:MAG: tetratricopeptide repeat protein [Woeseiaceae bacterium]
MPLFGELKRRSVFHIAATYLVVGWLLTEVLTTLLPAFGAPPWASRTVILVFALGFVPAIILSWVYEITPDGIKKDSEVDRTEAAGQRSSSRSGYAAVAAVAVAVILVSVFSSRVANESVAPSASVVSNASVAVLPFVNMSGNEENEYFSDGLTETLLHILAQVPELKVAARTSSFAFRDQNKTIVEIADALDVAHVLEGSVQRAGDRVRITAQLIRANDGFHVWSENYDRTLDDIFGIQDEIAAKVGGALSASLLGSNNNGTLIASATTSSPDAFDLYLQALQGRATYSHGGLQTAEGLLKGALTIDPDFLDAKTELAINYWQQVETGLMDQQSAFPNIVALVDQVIAIRPDDPNARAIRLFADAAARSLEVGPQVFLDAGVELEKIVAASPAAFQPKLMLTRIYQGTQQLAKAVPLMNDALVRDPLNPRIHYELGSLYSGLEQPDEARAALQKSLEIEPNQPNAYAILGGISLRAGDGLDYMRQILRAIEVDPADHELPGVIAELLYRLDLIDEGDDFRNRVLAVAPTSEIAYRIELIRALSIGDEVASIASARRAIEDDVNDRRFSFTGAVQHILRVAAKRGTVEEDSLYLNEQVPGLLQVDVVSAPGKYRTAQLAAFDAWYVALPREEMLARLETLGDISLSFGFDPKNVPPIYLGILALRGEVEEAVEVALAGVFSTSVAINLGWQETYALPQYADIVAEPRVQEAMRQWQAEEDALREQIRAFLLDLSTST